MPNSLISFRKASQVRILLVANTGWYLRNFRKRLVERLEAAGYEVVLSAPVDVEIQNEFFRTRRFEPLHLSRRGLNPFTELLVIAAFVRLLRRVRPSVILTWTPKPNVYGCIAGRLLHVPVIPNVSGLGAVFIRDGLFKHFVGMLYKFAFARCPAIFFQNTEDRALFIEANWITADCAERLPGSGVDLQHFQPVPLSVPEPFVFLYVGRLLADKGLRETVEAAKRLRADGRRFVLRIAGFLDPGNPAAISQTELDGWLVSDSIEYLGLLEDVRPALAAAHCVILPSYREGVPRSLLEAAAMARPLITTDTPGCRDVLIKEKSGFFCQPKDVASLADCMTRMLDSSVVKLTEMGCAGREYMLENFSEEIVLQAYLEQCRHLLGGPAGGNVIR